MFSDKEVYSSGEQEILLIGNLVDCVGMEPKTIRFYERAGLIKPHRVGNYRVYYGNDVEQLKVIKFLRALDVSIRAIKDLLERHGSLRLDNLPSEARNEIKGQLRKRYTEYQELERMCLPILNESTSSEDGGTGPVEDKEDSASSGQERDRSSAFEVAADESDN